MKIAITCPACKAEFILEAPDDSGLFRKLISHDTMNNVMLPLARRFMDIHESCTNP